MSVHLKSLSETEHCYVFLTCSGCWFADMVYTSYINSGLLKYNKGIVLESLLASVWVDEHNC